MTSTLEIPLPAHERQMLDAPLGAYYICNDFDYKAARDCSAYFERRDIQVRDVGWLMETELHTPETTVLVIDCRVPITRELEARLAYETRAGVCVVFSEEMPNPVEVVATKYQPLDWGEL
jgi:hypothetical protein